MNRNIVAATLAFLISMTTSVNADTTIVPKQPEPAAPPVPEVIDWTERVENASVLIVAGESIGTGTFVTPAYVLTAAHLLKGDVVVKFKDGSVAPAIVKYANETLDVALLRVLHVKEKIEPLKLNCDPVKPLQEFSWVGNPVGFENNWGKGYVSGIKQNAGYPWLIPVSATINHGDSGAGLISEDHEIIGIIIGMAGGDPSPNGVILPASNFCGIIITIMF